MQNAVADGDTRTISLHHVHTLEDLTVTYKRNGRYDAEALKKINWLLRDWRRNEEVETDPHLVDLVWEVQREVGARQPIHVICGYRSPQTNAMLRRTSGGVAQFSQHTLGKAMDFSIPGVPLEELRVIGLRLQRGGIGFYPTSGSPFVHLDVGNVRHWPTMSREELVRVFPNGRTVHVPSDGRPLPGYALALADIERRGGGASANSLNAARMAGLLSDNSQRDAEKSAGSLLARLLGFGKTEEHDVEVTGSVARTSTKPSVVTAAAGTSTKPSVVTAVTGAPRALASPASATVALPRGRPATFEVAAAAPSTPASRAPSKPPTRTPVELASAEVTAAASPPWPESPSHDGARPERALAYAPQSDPELTSRPSPASRLQPMPIVSIPPATSVVAKQTAGKAVAIAAPPAQTGQRFDDPWLRAAILAPNLQHYMTAAPIGAPDYRGLAAFMQKPSSSVIMAFSDEPQPGLAAGHFSGQAVVFVATVTFNARTAMLR